MTATNENGDPGRELKANVYALSGRCFAIAQEVEARPEVAPERKAEAMALWKELNELREEVRTAPDRSLAQALSEALVDINYILSAGRTPMSMRLGYHARSREAAEGSSSG